MSQDSPVTEGALRAILDEKLEEKLTPLRASVEELKSSASFLSDQFDVITKRVGQLEQNLLTVQQENNFLKSEVGRLSKSAIDLASEMNDIEQYSRRECVELTGLPEEPGEDTTKLALKVGSLMGLDLDDTDISVSHRLPKSNFDASYSSRLRDGTARNIDPALKFPKVIVKFVRREVKEAFYQSRKHLYGKTTRDIGLSRLSENKLYISESLSPRNRDLFKECRKFKRDQSYKFIWTHNGRVYLRRNKDSPARLISCKEDLAKIPR